MHARAVAVAVEDRVKSQHDFLLQDSSDAQKRSNLSIYAHTPVCISSGSRVVSGVSLLQVGEYTRSPAATVSGRGVIFP
jgi:hypothetical protein